MFIRINTFHWLRKMWAPDYCHFWAIHNGYAMHTSGKLLLGWIVNFEVVCDSSRWLTSSESDFGLAVR